jgi:PIN domain nuclease of toxin-antitoxin system
VSRLLVDTHALLWWLSLSSTARDAIADPTNEPLVSAASVWEMASFAWLHIAAQHAWHVRDLPMYHGDPFDRLIVAQALVERVPIVTTDACFGE